MKSKFCKVFVYGNLHKNCYSVKDWKTKLVIAHVDEILLIDAEFKVSESGRQRVLKEKCKNVHAGVMGFWDKKTEYLLDVDFNPVAYYNPYKYDSFVDLNTKKPLTKSSCVLLHKKGVYYV
jgi:hypothetical protein